MYGGRNQLEGTSYLSFKEFRRIRGVSRALAGGWAGGRLSNPIRCVCGSTHGYWARSREDHKRSRWPGARWRNRCWAFIISHRIIWAFVTRGGFKGKRRTRLVFRHFTELWDLTNLIRIGLGLSPFGKKWVTDRPGFRMPPVLFQGINIILVLLGQLI